MFDRVRTCDNHCPFCFIHQLPKGMRKSLYLKDDDYRLSFLYGNFTTLTRFTEADLERVVSERLGPLYVSIHATDPDVRTRLLRNRRGATSLRWLELILDAGIEVHGQVVVCPGINDGAVLDDTLLGVLDRFPALTTLGVVPLGVSAHNREDEMRFHTLAEAQAVVDIVERWQERYASRSAAAWCTCRTSTTCWPSAHSRPSPRTTNARSTRTGSAWRARSRPRCAPRSAAPKSWQRGRVPDSSRGSTARPPTATAPLARRRHRGPTTVTAGSAERWNVIVTGELGAAVLEPLLPELPGRVRLLPVKNGFFGGNIGVTGLLTGEDIGAALEGQSEHDRYLLPDVALLARPLPRRHDRSRAPAPGRDRAHRRRLPGPGSAPFRSDRIGVVMSDGLPVVAVVGRPNVGKSTLVNRFVGRRAAIVEERPGSHARSARADRRVDRSRASVSSTPGGGSPRARPGSRASRRCSPRK